VRAVAVAIALVLASCPFGARPATAAACDTPGQPTTTVYLPNITKTLGGANGWVTPFIVQNVGTAATTLEVSFYRFVDGALVTCRKISGLQPYTSFADVPNNDTDLPGDSQFAVVVRSFGAQVISVVNEHQGLLTPARAEALSYTGLTAGATSVYVPFVGKPEPAPCSAPQQSELLCNLRWLTTFVMQNFGQMDAVVTARFVSYDGASAATLMRSIAPGRSQFIDPSIEPLLVAGRYYAVTLTSSQPIGVIANAHDDAPTQTAPRAFSYNGMPQAVAGETFIPYVRRDGGPARLVPNGILIQNAGQADATPTLAFQKLGGGAAVTIAAPTPLKPGAAWYFDPEVFAIAGGYQLCAAAGPGKCIEVGEHSLVVSGGSFAVLNATVAPGAAMGYTGAAGQGNRAFVPNVTRTLGGAAGWTTPIVLQSSGATSATLRWYRFSDGALVMRQTVGPLSRGASTRIDPRTVVGLTDDTQYAVVVDAQGGNIVAVVTELNFSGGDGTMIYEGFPATVNVVPQATAVSVTPSTASVAPGGTAQFTATVKDQFDDPLTGQVNWSVAPVTLGTISPSGLFTASASAAGTGAVTATSGAVSGSAQITITVPQSTTVAGISFRLDVSGPADVYAESTITTADASSIVTQVNADIPQIAADFSRPYAKRPQVYVLSNTTIYIQAMQTILQIPFTEAQQAGATSSGVFSEGTNAIAVNWEKAKTSVPVSAMRHELTHLMEHQIVPQLPSPIPAWLDEGTARSEEFTIPNSAWRAMQNRYSAASMAVTGTLLSLADMTDVGVWNDRSGPAGVYQYYAASQAVQLLRNDLGLTGTDRIFELMGQGLSFEAAYQTVSGQNLSAFATSYPTRVRALAPAYPGIATAPDTSSGPGLSFMLYGFAPNTSVTVQVSGAANSGPNPITTSTYGTYLAYLGGTWPSGNYTISATWAGPTLSVSAVKTASFAVSGVGPLDPGETATLELAVTPE